MSRCRICCAILCFIFVLMKPAVGCSVYYTDLATENVAELGFLTDIYLTTTTQIKKTVASLKGDPWPCPLRVAFLLRKKIRARCIYAYHLKLHLQDEASPKAIDDFFNHFNALTILHAAPPTWLQKRTAYDAVDVSSETLVQRRCPLFLAMAALKHTISASVCATDLNH